MNVRVGGVESMSISALAFDLLPEENALIAGNLFGGVEFSGNARLVVIFVATRNEDTVAGSPPLEVDDAFDTETNSFDTPLLSLVVEYAEL